MEERTTINITFGVYQGESLPNGTDPAIWYNDETGKVIRVRKEVLT